MSKREPQVGSEAVTDLAAAAREFAIEGAVNQKTKTAYRALFRDVWSPLCRAGGLEPYGADASTVLAMYTAGRSGSMRRTGKGNRRTGMWSPGYLDSVLAAVRHEYLARGLTPPQHAIREKTRAEMRAAYQRDYIRHTEGHAQTATSVAEYRRLCSPQPFVDHAHAVIAVAGILALDHDATVRELTLLRSDLVSIDVDGVRLTLGERQLTLPCSHQMRHGMVPVCAACSVRTLLDFPPVGPSTAVLATHATHVPGSDALVLSLTHRLRSASRRFHWLRFGSGPQGPRLTFDPAADEPARLATRQGLALAPHAQAASHVQALAAAKLVACRGLTPRDLFTILTVSRVDDISDRKEDTCVDDASDQRQYIRLWLPATRRGTTQTSDWLEVWPQTDRSLCAVVALTEWLDMRRAAYGADLPPDEPVFVDSRSWWTVSNAPVTSQAPRVWLQSLLRRTGLPTEHTWKCLLAMYETAVVHQAQGDNRIYQSLRLKKPEHARAVADRQRTNAETPRRVASSNGTPQ